MVANLLVAIGATCTLALRGLASRVGLCLAALAVGGLFADPAWAVPEITVVQKRTTLSDGGSFNFGSVREDRSLAMTFTISNGGDTDLSISETSVEPPFEIVQPPVGTLAAGRRTTVRLNLPAGAAPGPVSAVLTIVNDDPNENPFTVALTGQVSAVEPEIDISTNSNAVPTGSAVDLGTVEAGVGVARKFLLRNLGNANLELGTPSVSGEGFTIEFPKSRVVKPGKKLTFTVRFSRNSSGEFEGRVRIPSNDPDEESYEFEVSAETTPADARVKVFSQGKYVPNGGDVSFGETRSDRNVDRTFTIRNEGRATLTIDDVGVSGDGFVMLTEPRTSLARGKSTKFKVRLTPSGSNAVPEGLLSFATNAPDDEEYEIGLNAEVNAVSPMVSVVGPGGPIENGETFDFGVVDINETAQRTFTISNGGSADLVIGTVNVAGTGYALASAPATTIRAGRSTTFTIRLQSAGALNPASGSASFTTNVAGTPTFTISLTGQVAVVPPSPEIEVVENALSPTGTPITRVVGVGSTRNFTPNTPVVALNTLSIRYTIVNRGTADLTLSGLAIDNTAGTAFSITSGSPLPASIPATNPDSTHDFIITFAPTAQGTFSAIIVFNNNDPDDGEGPVFRFTVTGEASPPVADYSVRYEGFGQLPISELPPGPPAPNRPYPFSLGAIPAGGGEVTHSIDPDYFVIKNTGASPLIFTNVEYEANVLWLGTGLDPGPCFPVSCPRPPGQDAERLIVKHTGLVAGQNVVMLSIKCDLASTPPTALPDFRFEIQEWVNDWFDTSGGLNGGTVRTFAEFDPDGAAALTFSPQVYAAGGFTTPAGSPRIARLNTTTGTWEALPGGGINTAGGTVKALVGFDTDGSPNTPDELYVAGGFTSVGSTPIAANNIAKWDGRTGVWSTLSAGGSNGVTGSIEGVNAMAVFNFDPDGNGPIGEVDHLIVGGTFTNAGGVIVESIARWSSAGWGKLLEVNDGVVQGKINAMTVFDTDGSGSGDPELYVAGNFQRAGGLTADAQGIARFTGSSWALLPGFQVNGVVQNGVSGANARINAMVVYDEDGPDHDTKKPVLVVAGSFLDAGGVQDVNNIAVWVDPVVRWRQFSSNGIVPIAPGTPDQVEVFALALYDEDSIHTDDRDGNIETQRTMPARLYAAGNFGLALQSNSPANNVARWDPVAGQWKPVGTDTVNGTNGQVQALFAFDTDGATSSSSPSDPAHLLIGGFFTEVRQLGPDPDATLSVQNVAIWGWSDIPTP